jgi:hypothetical protein
MPDQQLFLADDWLPYKEDRNASKGGRSFYFFDLDDNILHMDTRIVLFRRDDRSELEISSSDLAAHSADIGLRGPYADYFLDSDDRLGSFRNFRDPLFGSSPLISDVESAISGPAWEWHGPSWNHFFYAVLNRRPVSIITARGHRPSTIRRAMNMLHRRGHLLRRPNFLAIYPVTNPRLRRSLFRDPEYARPVAELKYEALIMAVEKAFRRYGANPHHRFGVSDDDPRNIEEISRALVEVKKRYPRNSFFVIDSSRDRIQKTEIFPDHIERSKTIELSDALNYQLSDF